MFSSTEEKLQELKQLFADSDDNVLLDLLTMCGGDIHQTKKTIGVSDLNKKQSYTDTAEKRVSFSNFPHNVAFNEQNSSGLEPMVPTHITHNGPLGTLDRNHGIRKLPNILRSRTRSKNNNLDIFLKIGSNEAEISQRQTTAADLRDPSFMDHKSVDDTQDIVNISQHGKISLAKDFSKLNYKLVGSKNFVKHETQDSPCPNDLLEMSLWEHSLLQQKQGSGRQVTLRKFLQKDVDENSNSSKPDNKTTNSNILNQMRLSSPAKTLHLYDPEDVAQYLPCTMHLQIFPPSLANRLLEFLIKESDSWDPNQFYMFDRAVSSPHTTSFYTNDYELYKSKSASYNGVQIKNPRLFNEDMREACKIVERVVNQEIKKRGLKKYQYPGKWTTNAAVCNRYNGAKESVGFHSDQLTHLGPHCVIASVSLGVTREFRLKERLYQTKEGTSTKKTGPGISIHLPHNSLTIMHAGCQEEYKHSLMPGSKIDAHPIGKNMRINITYRMYLKEFEIQKNPTCFCKRPMILRTMAADSQEEGGQKYKFMWMCGSNYSGKEK